MARDEHREMTPTSPLALRYCHKMLLGRENTTLLLPLLSFPSKVIKNLNKIFIDKALKKLKLLVHIQFTMF